MEPRAAPSGRPRTPILGPSQRPEAALARRARREGVAVLWSLVGPGLGHLYCGRLGVGFGLLLGAAVLATGLLAVWGVWLFVPLVPLSIVIAAWFAVQVACISDLRDCVRRGVARRPPPPLDHPAGLFAVLLLGFVLPIGVTGAVLSARYVGTVEIRDLDMFPRLLPGDHVLYDRSAYRQRPPAPGELVVLESPGTGLKVARVLARGGELVEWRRGRPFVDGVALTRDEALSLRVARLTSARDAERLAGLVGAHEARGERTWLVGIDAGAPEDQPPLRLAAEEVFVIGDRRSPDESPRPGRVPLAAIGGRPRFVWASADPEGGWRSGRPGLDVR